MKVADWASTSMSAIRGSSGSGQAREASPLAGVAAGPPYEGGMACADGASALAFSMLVAPQRLRAMVVSSTMPAPSRPPPMTRPATDITRRVDDRLCSRSMSSRMDSLGLFTGAPCRWSAMALHRTGRLGHRRSRHSGACDSFESTARPFGTNVPQRTFSRRTSSIHITRLSTYMKSRGPCARPKPKLSSSGTLEAGAMNSSECSCHGEPGAGPLIAGS